MGSGILLNCSEDVFTDAAVTDSTLRLIIRARHSGFGINDGTSVFVQFGDKRIPIDPARSTRRLDGYEDLAFAVPELSGTDASARIPVSIITVGASASAQHTRESNFVEWAYAMPIIQQVHLRGTSTSGQFELTVVGFNFGSSPGDVLLLSGDADLDGDGIGSDGCSSCVISQGNAQLPSYVQSWTHREIQIRYMGSTGQIRVMSGGGTHGGSVLSPKRLSSNPISFNTTSPALVGLTFPSSSGVWLGYETSGTGQMLTLVVENAYGDASKLKVLVGDAESGTPFPQQENDCVITNIDYPIEDGRDRSRISCIVPKGQGGEQRVVVVREGVLRSLASAQLSIAYVKPTLVKLMPAEDGTDFQLSSASTSASVASSTYLIETRGQKIVARGSNFGGDNDSAIVFMDGVPLKTASRSTDNSELSFIAPCGSGLNPRTLWISVSGQTSCELTTSSLKYSANRSTTGTCMEHSIAYQKPVVDGIVVPPPEGITTEGGFDIQLRGKNFIARDCFDPSADPMVVLVGESPCKIKNSTYAAAWCIIEEGVGRDQQISVSVDGQNAPVPDRPSAISGGSGLDSVGTVDELFKYPPPYVTQVQPFTDLPTSGGMNISIVGGNFGSRKTTTRLRVYFLQQTKSNAASAADVKDIVLDLQTNPDAFHFLDHKLLVLSSPPGEGADCRVVVEVGGPTGDLQNSSETILISYAAPLLHSVSVTEWPTSGCVDGSLEDVQAWSSRLDGVTPSKVSLDPLLYGRRCNAWFMLKIKGSNFGRANGMLRVWAEHASTSTERFALWPPRETHDDGCRLNAVREHDNLLLCSPVGFGADISLTISVAGQRVTLGGFRFEKPVVRSSSPNPYSGGRPDILVTGSKGGNLVKFRGINFGAVNSTVQVLLNGKNCQSARWQPASPEDGLPYVSCNAPQDVVGPKNLSLTVAGQASRPIPLIKDPTRSVVRSVCGEGPLRKNGRPDVYWGRVGELCSPCPIPGGLCQPGTYNAPTALPGFFLRYLDISRTTGSDEIASPKPGSLARREKTDTERALEELPLRIIDNDGTTAKTAAASRRCPAERYFDPVLDKTLVDAFPEAVKWRRDLCEEVVPCQPEGSCLGGNNCGPEYLYLRKQCLAAANESTNDRGARIGGACNVSLQCQAISQGQVCIDAITEVCACPAEWELGSYTCLKRCIREHTGALQSAGCTDVATLEHRLAGGECSAAHPENCQQCVAETDPLSQETHGTCVCSGGAQRCALCTQGEYFRLNGACEACPRNVGFMIALFVAALFLCCVACYLLDQRGFNMALVSIGVDYFQVMGLLASTDIRWPEILMSLFRLMSFFNINIDIVGPECLVPNLSFELKFYGTIFFPVVVFACMAVVGICISVSSSACPCIFRGRGARQRGKHMLSKLVGTFLLILYFAYLMVTRRALDVFNCNPTKPSDGYLYASFTSLECAGGLCRCYYPGHVQARLVAPAAIAALIYGLGFPLGVLSIIRKNKTKIKLDQILRALGTGDDERSNPEAIHTRRRYRMMYYHFKPGKIYWIVYILARKLGIATAGLLFRANPGFQMACILLVMFVSYVWQVKHQPYMSTAGRKEVVAEHRAKAASGNALHSRIAKWVEHTDAQQNGRERLRSVGSFMPRSTQNLDKISKLSAASMVKSDSKTGGKKKKRKQAARKYFWDFNTVEQVLISCAIFICLAGVMFESDRFSGVGDAYSWQRDLLTYLTIACVLFSVIYYGAVMTSEVCGCTPKWLQKILATKHKMSHHTTNHLRMGAENVDGDADVIEMTSMGHLMNRSNPMQNRDKWRSQQLEAELEAVREELNKLREINVHLVGEHRTQDRLTSTQSTLLYAGKKLKTTSTKKKTHFGQRQTSSDDGESSNRKARRPSSRDLINAAQEAKKKDEIFLSAKTRKESLNPLNGHV
jgi:hypothetical protein